MSVIRKGLEKILGEEKTKKLNEFYNSPFIANYFENKISKKRFKKIKDYKLSFKIGNKNPSPYEFGVGAFALDSYSRTVAFILEKLWAGFTWKEHLFTRAIATITNTSTEWFFERTRNKVFDKLHVTKEERFKRYMVDTVLFVGLNLPLHFANMSAGKYLTNGKLDMEDLMQMATASLPLIPFAGFLGGPYGKYLDRLRIWNDFPVIYGKKKQDNKFRKI